RWLRLLSWPFQLLPVGEIAVAYSIGKQVGITPGRDHEDPLACLASFKALRTAPGVMNFRSAIWRTVAEPDSTSSSHWRLRSVFSGAPAPFLLGGSLIPGTTSN